MFSDQVGGDEAAEKFEEVEVKVEEKKEESVPAPEEGKKKPFVNCYVPPGMKGDVVAVSQTIAWAQYSQFAGSRRILAYQRISQGEILRNGVQPEWIPFKTYNGTQRISGTGTYRNPETGDETLFFRVDEEEQLACVVLRADGREDRCAAEISIPVAERPWGRVWIVACGTWKCIASLDDGAHYSLVSFTPNSERGGERSVKKGDEVKHLVSIPKDAMITNMLHGKLSYVYTSDERVYLATVTLNEEFAFSTPEIVELQSNSTEDTEILRVQALDVPLFGGYTVALYMLHGVFYWREDRCLVGIELDSPMSTVVYGENSDVLCAINGMGIIAPLSIAGYDPELPDGGSGKSKYVRQEVQAICPGGGYFHQFNCLPSSTFYKDWESRTFMVHRRGQCYVVFRDDRSHETQQEETPAS